MKKIMLLLAFAGISFTALAQETTTTETPTLKHKVVTNGFWSNWFLDLGGDFISNYSSQEVGVKKDPFSNLRGNFALDLSLGKWVKPSFGMRAKFQAAWATQVNSNNKLIDGLTVYESYLLRNQSYNQLIVNLQPMLNLHNLFGGYKPRTWNTILYASAGYQHNFTYSDGSIAIGAGWLNTFNVTKRFHINIDIYADMLEAKADGVEKKHLNKTILGLRDWQVGWSLGFGFNLGKVGWDNAPDVDAIMAMNKAQLDALNASLIEQQEENARIQAHIKNHKCPEAVTQVTKIVSAKASVFFNIDKSKIASKKDLVNVQELAEAAKASGQTMVVTGYADFKTGTPAYNQKLSEKRAQVVAEELVKMGVSRDKIEVVGKGGVKDLSPISYNRRVVVSIK